MVMNIIPLLMSFIFMCFSGMSTLMHVFCFQRLRRVETFSQFQLGSTFSVKRSRFASPFPAKFATKAEAVILKTCLHWREQLVILRRKMQCSTRSWIWICWSAPNHFSLFLLNKLIETSDIFYAFSSSLCFLHRGVLNTTQKIKRNMEIVKSLCNLMRCGCRLW